MLSAEQTQLITPSSIYVLPKLRPYQIQFIKEVYEQIRAGSKRILGVAPTGSGKTWIAAQIIQHAVSRENPVLFVVHRDTLVSQTDEKLSCFRINSGFIKAGWKENPQSLVQIASVQTLPKRDWWRQYPAKVIVIDECHIVAYASIVQQMMACIHPQALYLGLTATPWRLSKRESLGDIFPTMVCAPMPHALIDAGFLVKPSYYSVTLADLKRVGTAANGDFDEGQLVLACDRPELVEQIVRDWHNLAYGRRTIAFAVNVVHSRHLAEAFSSAGIPAAHVDGTTKSTDKIYQQLENGEILVLCSCMKLVEGFDVPSVSAVLLCRPTMSRALHFQMLSRALRLSPETEKIDAVIVDQVGSVQRHGFVEDIRQITLESGSDSIEGKVNKKICPPEHGGCGAILYAFHLKCYKCGYIFEQPKKVYLVPGLEQLLSEEDRERYEFYRHKLREAYQKSFAPGWAAMVFKERYGHWSPDAWEIGAIFGENPTAEQQSSYYNYLAAIARRLERSESWIQRCMESEFGFRQSA